MQSDRLHPDEVIATGQVLRNREADTGDVLRGERDGRAAIGLGGNFIDLEPDRAIAVEGGGGLAGGSLGHVDVDDTVGENKASSARVHVGDSRLGSKVREEDEPGVVDRSVGHDTEGRSSSNSSSLCGRVRRRVVAPEISARHIGDLNQLKLQYSIRIDDVNAI